MNNIFRRFRRWFIDKYLPAYVSTANKEDIEELRDINNKLTHELEKVNVYCAGLQYAIRHYKVSVNLKK